MNAVRTNRRSQPPVANNTYRAGDRLSGGTRAGIPGAVVVLSSYDSYVDLGFVPDDAAEPSEVALCVAVKDLTLLPVREDQAERAWAKDKGEPI